VEVTPDERFVHMIETLFGLARLGHTNNKGMPHPLQLALFAREFSDVFVFRAPPPTFQRAIFGALAPIARPTRLSRDVPAAPALRWHRGRRRGGSPARIALTLPQRRDLSNSVTRSSTAAAIRGRDSG
jgi:hypothetical protein